MKVRTRVIALACLAASILAPLTGLSPASAQVTVGPYAHFGDTVFLGVIEAPDVTIEGDLGGSGYYAPLFQFASVNLEGAGTVETYAGEPGADGADAQPSQDEADLDLLADLLADL